MKTEHSGAAWGGGGEDAAQDQDTYFLGPSGASSSLALSAQSVPLFSFLTCFLCFLLRSALLKLQLWLLLVPTRARVPRGLATQLLRANWR